MLVIIGMILLLTWIFEHAFHLTADSLINLLLKPLKLSQINNIRHLLNHMLVHQIPHQDLGIMQRLANLKNL